MKYFYRKKKAIMFTGRVLRMRTAFSRALRMGYSYVKGHKARCRPGGYARHTMEAKAGASTCLGIDMRAWCVRQAINLRQGPPVAIDRLMRIS